MLRYMAFAWDSARSTPSLAARHLSDCLRSSDRAWKAVFSSDGISVYLAGASSKAPSYHPILADHGVVIGTLFRKKHTGSPQCPAGPLPIREAETVVDSCGRLLLQSYWGRYVAFVRTRDRGALSVVRDPTGNLACYHAEFQGVHLFFANVVDGFRLGALQLSVDETRLVARVATGPTILGGSALAGVAEVGRGECFTVHPRGHSRRLYWDPISISSSTQTWDLDTAADAVRSVFTECVNAWSTRFESVLVRLSGGLDSSCVAGALGKSPHRPSITCVTYYMPAALSDERPWARLACSTFPCIHVEHQRNVQVDLRRILDAAPTPLPVDYFLYLEITPIERELARQRKATATFTGDGGDTLFGSDCRDFLVSDYVRRYGLRPKLHRVAEQAALLTNTTVWFQLSRIFRRPEIRWAANAISPNRQLLSDSAKRAQNGPILTHPWFPDTRPESWALFVQLLPLVANIAVHDPFCPSHLDAPEIVDVIDSQPLVELCLQIPLFVHAARGVNRAILRRAMAGVVPAEILARTWKDRSPGSTETLLSHNLSFVREFLLDGYLTDSGLLDKAKLESYFSTPALKTSTFAHEVLDHVYVEAWYQLCRRASLHIPPRSCNVRTV